MTQQHDFQAAPEGWSEKLHERDGRVVARLLHRGSEVHFEISPSFGRQVIYRNVAREFLKSVFDEHGFLTTKVTTPDERSRRFVERFGFKHTWSDMDYDYFMLTALPFEKKGK